MTLPACMRIETHWTNAGGISCGGSHIYKVCRKGANMNDPDTRFRILWCHKLEPWRWRLSPEMATSGADTLIAKARECLHRDSANLEPLRHKLEQYASTVMTSRFKAHRKRMAPIIEQKELMRTMRDNPVFGSF